MVFRQLVRHVAPEAQEHLDPNKDTLEPLKYLLMQKVAAGFPIKGKMIGSQRLLQTFVEEESQPYMKNELLMWEELMKLIDDGTDIPRDHFFRKMLHFSYWGLSGQVYKNYLRALYGEDSFNDEE